MKTGIFSLVIGGVLGTFASISCAPGSPQVGSQTNWLRVCESDDECGGLLCVCGACTKTCEGDEACGEGFGSCVGAANRSSIAFCNGKKPTAAMCLASCDEASCPEGSYCLADVCVPREASPAKIAVDSSVRHQTLVGFGASLAFDEVAIDTHPERDALLDAMFADSGFDVVRVRNAFNGDNQSDLEVAARIASEAASRLGRKPTILLSGGSPPASLKANGDRFCANSDPTCTLAKNAGGEFDYVGFGNHWRASLEAYEAVGLHPDFVSIQNNVDYLPPGAGIEACRFLPNEGTSQVETESGVVEAEFAGYREALDAVHAATDDLGPYTFAAPEVGSVVMVTGYTEPLATSSFDALALHMYGSDPETIDEGTLEALGEFAKSKGKPIFQTEMQADGFGTALLAHYALATASASAYLHLQFVGAREEASLIDIEDGNIALHDNYYALVHFARATAPGWVRIDASSDANDVLSSAWLSPDEKSLTLVVVNRGEVARDAEITLPEAFSNVTSETPVVRTTFDGIERMEDVGPLPSSKIVRVPARSIVTVRLVAE